MNKLHLLIISFAAICLASLHNFAFGNDLDEDPFQAFYVATSVTTIANDTIPLQERYGDFINNEGGNPFDLSDPKIIEQNVEYDPESGLYMVTEKVGEDYYRTPTYMTFDEYLDWRSRKQERSYFNKLAGLSSSKDNADLDMLDPVDQLVDKLDLKKDLIDRLFGSPTVNIEPQGNIDLTFGVDFQNVENPILTERQRRQGGFDFDMDINMNVNGQIGEKLNLSTSYNTQAAFDFDRQIMKLDYNTQEFSEDEIIQKIEAGNVSLPLRGTLIQGSQSLFGLKTELKFGHLRLTAIASQQNSEREQIEIQGGSQLQEFEVYADEYDENRHFFLTHFNRGNFEESMDNLPQIRSLFQIEQVDVWITNDRNTVEDVRDIVALVDLAEPTRLTGNVSPAPGGLSRDITGEYVLPHNDANGLYRDLVNNPRVRAIDQVVSTLQSASFGLQQAKDFEKVSARRLRQGSEYTIHPELGFVSINVNVRPDQVIGVAFQYSYNGKTYKVGELYNDSPSASTDTTTQNVLFVKMLKSTTPRVDLPAWDLMMKNVYSIGAYNVNPQDFKLDVYYEDPGKGEKRFLPSSNLAGQPLLRVLNLDNLNTQGDPQPDGVFDFVNGVTINPRNGRVMFPVLEPFGSSLGEQITDDRLRGQYVYQQLYDSTITRAREFPEFNRFALRGSYRSSVSSEISLNAFNIPRGSVRVSAGGQVLVEGQDYEIDYNIGRIRILNDALLNQGAPIKVSFEDNALFGLQRKTMLGVRADYEVGDNFNVGATYMHLFERPFTQKVNINDDPINNRIFGVDVNFSQEAPWATRLVDAIPFIDTKAPSSFSFSAEAAALKPGHSKAINEESDEESGGVVYIDDFEGSASSFDLRTPPNNWVLASVPQNDAQNNNPLFPESAEINSTLSGVNRARLNWYRIDQGLNSESSDSDNPYVAQVPTEEVFPNKQIRPDQLPFIQTLDLAYYPDERGPYNFDLPSANGGTQYSAGINSFGGLEAPETRWAGIMRSLTNTDFEASNIEFMEFWVLSPFLNNPDDPDSEGDLYLNIGNISEDILRDSRKFFENGLPGPANPSRRVDETSWGIVPLTQQITNSFDNDPETREVQDVGLDGMSDAGEQAFFSDYLNAIRPTVSNAVFSGIEADPSNDNYRYYRDYDDNTPVLQRYSAYNNTEGNSQPPQGTERFSATNIPDAEDLNRDNTLNETESYFQYKIPLRANGREIDYQNNPYIIDRIESENDYEGVKRVWYKFRIPLNDPGKKSVGGIQDFRAIRFIRMYMHGFKKPVVLRFARLELIRNQWRRYQQPLSDPDVLVPGDDDVSTIFDVGALNIEENSDKSPFNYVLPVGIRREQSLGVFTALQNEQSMSIRVQNLQDGDARGIFKNVNLDMRVYERLKMFVHAEAMTGINNCEPIEKGDMSLFIRLGSDFKNNFYEYEIPLTPSSDTLSPPPSNTYNEEYAEGVWLTDNEMDLPLALLRQVKEERNKSGLPLNELYSIVGDPDKPDNVISVKGNPNLGLVKGVMIGVRNRLTNDADEHCAEVWVNELRLNGLDERGGYAAIARMDMQLADFGGFTVSGNYSSIGFGGIDQQLAQRSREDIMGYDIAGNVELGKFFPEQSGIKIPVYAQLSNTTRVPEFDPYDLDIVLKDKLAAEADRTVRDSIREQANDVTTIKSINFTNVRKERTNTERKPMPWDISNFSFTYAYTETEHKDPIIESDLIDNHRGAIDYSYAHNLKPITPFKNLFKNDKYLKLISDFNFNPIPNSFSFSTELDRYFAQTTYRFTDLDPIYSTFYNKRLTWDRNYNLNWDISRGLKVNFNALSNSVVDEPDELKMRENPLIQDINQYRRDSIWAGIRDLGRPKNYTHNFNVNYTVPLKQIPFLDWINVKAQYNANYGWAAAALNVEELGNVIQNGQSRQLTGDFNFENLYNKSDFLKKINRPSRSSSRSSRSSRSTTTNTQEGDKKDKKKNKGEPSKAARIALRPLMLLRKARFSWTEDYGTVVPGFTPETRLLGLDKGFNAPGWDFVAGLQPQIRTLDPQTGFYTADDWLYQNADWISSDIFFNQQVQQNYSQRIEGRVTIEPFDDFRLELDANRDFTENHSQYFKDTSSIDDRNLNIQQNGFYVPTFSHAVPRNVGSMTISYFALNTLFQDTNDQITDLFNKFEDNRVVISQKIGEGEHEDETLASQGYTNGYGRTQQDILIPAFLAAYTGKDINLVEVDQEDYAKNVLFKELPRVNWRLTYSGLTNLPWFKDIFQSMSVTHGYRSTLSVNTFNTDLDYLQTPGAVNPNTFDLYSRFEIPEVVISEQFAPLLAVDMRLKNSMSLKVDFKKSRNLAMSFVSNQLAETQTEEYVIGFGYRMKNVQLFSFLSGGGKKKSSDESSPAPNDPLRNLGGRRGGGQADVNDFDITFDFSLRDDVTFNHILDQDIKEPTRGTRTLRISPAATYQFNERLSLRFFFDYNKTTPRVSSSFPITSSQGGVTVRFSLN